MAGVELKIEDEYVEEMARFLEARGADLQEGMDSYLTILETIRQEAIKEGATADALDVYITYAEHLKATACELGRTAKTMCNNFLAEVDDKDQYLF